MPRTQGVAALIADLGADPGFPGNSWTGWGTGGAVSDTSINERAVGFNSAMRVGTVLFVVLRNASGDFQAYKSTDRGATWSTSGSAFTPTDSGGGLCPLLIGTDIYVWYSRGIAPGHTANANSRYVFLNIFDTVGETWGTEDSFDCSVDPVVTTSFRVEGPWSAHVRPDGSIVLVIEEVLGADPCVVTWDAGVWDGPFRFDPTFHTQLLFDASIMQPDGTVDVFLSGPSATPYAANHAVFHADNSVDAAVAMSFTGDLIDWAGDGLYYGFEDEGTFYLGAGKKTGDYPTIWGRPAILYGSDGGGWVLGQLLDAGFDSDFSVYSTSLQKVNGWLIYTWRGISSDGNDFVERVGWAPIGSHDTPADWTFVTAYDHRTPSPAVSGQSDPYQGGFPPRPSGMSTGLILDGFRIHFVTTIRGDDGEIFSTYLLYIDVSVVVNEFRVGRAYFGQGT